MALALPRVQSVEAQATENTSTSATAVIGSGFDDVTSVAVRGAGAASWCVVSPTEIVIENAPGGPALTPASVVVSTPAGNSLAALVPAAPTDVHAHASGAKVMVTFKAPRRTGYAITYTVRAVPGGRSVRTRAARAVIRGLKAGRRYDFVVTARDRFGSGPASRASNTVRVAARR